MNQEPENQVENEVQPLLVEKPRKKRGRKPGFKATRFDLDLLYLLREGANTLEALVQSLSVAQSELLMRLSLLTQAGLIVLENNEYRLSIKGYNYYVSKTRAYPRLKKAITEETAPVKRKEEKKHEAPIPGQKTVSNWLLSTEVVDLGGKLGKMDLQEIMKRYGPTEDQKAQFLQRKAVQTLAPTRPQQPKTEVSPDSCELCKSSFKLSVSEPELTKYGHCFCGAAYHKDCYNSLLNEGTQCIRCGKKLLLIIDKQSREVINKIKDVFE